jgi:hypothetical protein
MLWPLFTAVRIEPSSSVAHAAHAVTGCSVASSGSDIMLYFLSIISLAVLAWRFTLKLSYPGTDRSIKKRER